MKTLFRLVVAVLLIGGWALVTLAMHVVRGVDPADGSDRWLVVPKSRLGIEHTYADVRAWTPYDVGRHTGLVRRLIDSGKADILLPAVPEDRRSDLAAFLQETLANPPAAPPSTAPAATQPSGN